MIVSSRTGWFLGLVILMASCIEETETDLDRAISRDNLIMEEYIASNNIEATKAQSGFYYEKTVSQPEAAQFENADYIGMYYEMKTIDGQLIDSYLDESMEPKYFKYSQEGLWPIAITYAAGLAREGEEMMVYAPSYLAFGNYGYEQLILPASNLVIQLKFVKKYTEEELQQREIEMIQAFIEENDLEGFEEIEEGIFFRTVEAGDDSKSASQLGSNVSIDFELFELGADEPTFDSYESNQPTTFSVGTSGLTFLDEGMKGVLPEEKVEILATSFAAYDNSIQIVPEDIRLDLVEKGEQIDLVKPFTPIWFKGEVLAIQ
ncbi:hypothetical protein SAMN04488057_102273 [Cyclobacterium lianum]|uniref:peptidylprolyl isomerase n=1 Tax=Cyclobacterium lianum TaxID=388280 RepID=A0A1M7K4F7_9BACT|nr:hypothetical protein [Cyclobacterium lianum]SHM59707.1 hypothetical protein SAMN04488057_102273 [Cyclobacterium lianum]